MSERRSNYGIFYQNSYLYLLQPKLHCRTNFRQDAVACDSVSIIVQWLMTDFSIDHYNTVPF